MAAEDAEVEVPPTLKALLAARLDQLDEAERRVLERGSVEGEIFHRGGVQALAPEETQVTTRLAALVRRQLVRPDRAQLAGDDGYRFRHLLIRDAAYDALPKAVRADLHARFADWLDEHGHALVERDEIVGYHLEQASPLPRGARAARRQPRRPRRGPARRRRQPRDRPPGLPGRSRAARLAQPSSCDRTGPTSRSSSSPHGYTESLDVRAAVETAEAVTERAEAAGDHSGAMLARAMALQGRSFAGEPDATDEVIALCRAALPLEEERGDPRRLALLWEMLASAAEFHQQNDDVVEASLQALRYQRLAGYSRSETWLEWSLIIGPRPADDAMRMIDELADWRPPGSQDVPRAVLLAMLGRFDEAWPLAEARSSHLREVTGNTSRDAYGYLALIATIEGDRERACRVHRRRDRAHRRRRHPGGDAPRRRLARDLCYLGRFDEAERLLEEARAVPPPGSGVRVMAAAAEALLLAHRGELEQAEALARTAVATAETKTDNVWWQASTHEDLATVLERAGRIDEAREALERSLAIWERKGCLPCATRLASRSSRLSARMCSPAAKDRTEAQARSCRQHGRTRPHGATNVQPNASSLERTMRHEDRVRRVLGGTRRHASTQNDTGRHELASTWSRTKTCARAGTGPQRLR